MTHIDEHGTKRDHRPNASELFMEQLQRSLDKVKRYAQLSVMAGVEVPISYVEHKQMRGIPLIYIDAKFFE